MRKVHLYNPENDIALQRNGGDFTAPAAAAGIAAAGAFLPTFYASEGDLLIPNKYSRRFKKEEVEVWMKEISEYLSFKARPLSSLEDIVAEPRPWGWSKAAAEVFARAGLDKSLIPSQEELDCMRTLSHRRITIPLSHEFQAGCGYKVWTPFEARSVKDAIKFISLCNEKVMVKFPYSCSGRGVFSSEVFPSHKLIELIEKGIASQGSVMIERLHRRVKDFAIIVDYSFETPEILFYSAFATTDSGFYEGNIVAQDDFIRSEIISLAGKEIVIRTETALFPALRNVLGNNYKGILGVDMLVATGDSGNYINPMVELNLRHTAGYVAGMMARNYLSPGSRGYLTFDSKGEAAVTDVVTDSLGRIVSGRFCLTPGHSSSQGFILNVSEHPN